MGVSAVSMLGCGGGGGKSLDDFLPEIPKPTGDAQSVWAGQISADNSQELIDGPASSGLVGDFFMRNSRGRFVIQSPTRVIGVVPEGGNLVDAVPLDANGDDAAEDQFGELSLIYLVGRTCRHDDIEVLQDGSGGGAAAIRATGVAEANNFINLRGIGLLNIPLEIDPDIDDGVECATTYILEPDSDHIEVRWTLYNPGDTDINGPVGTLSDTGGEVGAWGRTRGFESLDIQAIVSNTDPAPTDYVVYQGPDVGYGMLPRHDDPSVTNSTFSIAGVSIILFGAKQLLDILDPDKWFLHLPAGGGINYAMDVSVGKDAADAEAAFYADETLAPISGSVAWSGGGVPDGARVGVFEDANGNGTLEDTDPVIAYFDPGPDGKFSGTLKPGDYMVRAAVRNQARSDAQPVTLVTSGVEGVNLTLPTPVKFDYEIHDVDTTNLIPAKLTIIGRNPVEPDERLWDRYDTKKGVVRMVFATHGSTSVGAMPDEPFYLPPGTYRVLASRGTEWSVDSQTITVTDGEPAQNLTFNLMHVVDTPGYIASEYHVHQVGSPDAPILNTDRVKSEVCEGMELFSTSDHDYVADLQPVVESLGLQDLVHAIPGIEVTPFVYGHFNAWPLTPDYNSPNHGAIDWAEGMDGYAMIPGEIFDAMRSRGAEMVEINHPRKTAGSLVDFQQFFDRAGMTYDFDNRKIDGDPIKAPVPNEWMRLPSTSLWSDAFNALEVWNGFSITDSNGDGVRENAKLDMVMRDWFNLMSLGMDVVPIGNSDSHATVKDPPGMPRTFVRVTDDSSSALSSGNVVGDVLATLKGSNGTPKDVVVTDGPFIQVVATGAGQADDKPLGKVIDASGGTVTLDIEVVAAAWAPIDTIEIFANETMDVGKDANPSVLQPRFCFTSRTGLADNDPCMLATGGAQALTVATQDLGNGISRVRATASITITPGDIQNRTGATGQDAWIVVRAFGRRALYPILLTDAVTDDNIDTLVSGTPQEVETALDGIGIPAEAFTAPIYVDFDGGGYQAVFAP